MGSSLNLKGGSTNPNSIIESFTQDGHNFVIGDAIRYDMGTAKWVKAKANNAENSEVAGVVSAITSSSVFDITYSGYISIPALSSSTYPVLFLDSITDGGLTASPPSAIGTVVKPVLTKTSNGTGYLVTNYLGTQIGGSSTVAIDEIQPVGTVVPFAGSAIPDSWLACDGASYAIGSYPNLYAKLQYTSGDRAPLYGHVAVLTCATTPPSVGSYLIQGSGASLVRARVIATTTNTCTVQTVPVYSTTSKKFIMNNAVFFVSGGLQYQDNGVSTYENSPPGTSVTVTGVSITHFNTPDMGGRVAVGFRSSALGEQSGLELDTTYSSTISAFDAGSQGGQEATIALTGVNTTTPSAYVTSNNTSGSLLANMPPYTVMRYIIKASPYTRAAIIDGIDIPYTSLLVGDLRDGSLRPSGSGEALVFKTNDGTSGVERMRLTDIGLGIATGTSTLGATLDVAGSIRSQATTASTSTATGALIVAGGAGIAGALYVGGITTAGGVTMGGALTVGGAARVNSAVPSTSTTTGALIVTGGLGVAGALYVGGITTAGGVTMGGALTVGGAAKINSGTPSTTTTSGALTVAGGVGIGGALNVGGGISAGGGITLGTAQLAVPSGDAPIFGARAWAKANITSADGAGTLTSSGNMSSVSIVGGKQITFTFSTAMPDAHYSISAIAGIVAATNDGYVYNVYSQTAAAFTVVVGKRGDAFGDIPLPFNFYVVVHR
tara:strand:- start:50728 stop:52890 length:2163 start_codon:yes stop_codon:yes gene_type:complete